MIKNNEKKYISLVVMLVFAISFTGCGMTDLAFEPESNIVENDISDSKDFADDENQLQVDATLFNQENNNDKALVYTYTDMSLNMYAKSVVNVRDVPSADGNCLGTLDRSQAVKITGKCNENGWYRIEFNDFEAFVCDSFLAEENIASKDATDTKSKTGTSNNAGQRKAYFDKNKSLAVFDLINAERAANGSGQLIWDENMYNFACVRAQQITANFAHDDSPYGENIGYMPYIQTANEVYMQYYNSPGHHANYLNGSYICGAVAIYEVDGVSYHVELFSNSTDNTYGNVAAQQSQAATEWGATVVATWTASNGMVFEILSDGNVAMHYGGYSEDQIAEAYNEFKSYMGFQ